MKKRKILGFKTISPFFEQERDGEKPFTIRRFDYKDPRFRALAQWNIGYDWLIRITNPATGESFIREIKAYSFSYYFNWEKALDPERELWERYSRVSEMFRIILLGDKVESLEMKVEPGSGQNSITI